MLTDIQAVETAAIEGTPRDAQVAPPGALQIVTSILDTRLALLEKEENREADAIRAARRALARETLECHVPLADRMGLLGLRKRLEDASFWILEPRLYKELTLRLAPDQAEDELCLVVLRAGVKRLLEEHGIVGLVQGRTKGLYSLYRKMRRLNCPPGSIMDRIGLRVIVPSIAACYRVLELLHTRFSPVPGTFDDYIAHPKANGYRSLHLCVYPVPDLLYKPVEFQIRTFQMHHQAQSGAAAHWRYKIEEDREPEGEARLKWLCGLLDQREPALDRAAFVQRLYHQVFDDRQAF